MDKLPNFCPGAWGGYVKKVTRATKSIAGWVNWVISCYKERGEVWRWTVSGVNVAADTWRHFIPPVLTLKLLSTTHCNNYALQQLCNSTTMQCKLYAQQAMCTTRHYAVPPWSTKHCKHYAMQALCNASLGNYALQSLQALWLCMLPPGNHAPQLFSVWHILTWNACIV